MAGLILLVPTAMLTLFGMQILDVFNDAGTFGAFGFLSAYFLISFAAPAYLRKTGVLRLKDTMLAIASVGAAAGSGGRQRLSGAVMAGEYLPVYFPWRIWRSGSPGFCWCTSARPATAADVTRRIYTDHGQEIKRTPERQIA